MKQSNIIVVEITHAGKSYVWLADSQQDVIDIAYSAHGLVYSEYTRERCKAIWGDAIPHDFEEMLNEHDLIVEIGNLDEYTLYPYGEADTEYEAAQKEIRRDLAECKFLTLEEAKEFVEAPTTHPNNTKAKNLVKELLANLV